MSKITEKKNRSKDLNIYFIYILEEELHLRNSYDLYLEITNLILKFPLLKERFEKIYKDLFSWREEFTIR